MIKIDLNEIRSFGGLLTGIAIGIFGGAYFWDRGARIFYVGGILFIVGILLYHIDDLVIVGKTILNKKDG